MWSQRLDKVLEIIWMVCRMYQRKLRIGHLSRFIQVKMLVCIWNVKRFEEMWFFVWRCRSQTPQRQSPLFTIGKKEKTESFFAAYISLIQYSPHLAKGLLRSHQIEVFKTKLLAAQNPWNHQSLNPAKHPKNVSGKHKPFPSRGMEA